jgi:hypothetical protein
MNSDTSSPSKSVKSNKNSGFSSLESISTISLLSLLSMAAVPNAVKLRDLHLKQVARDNFIEDLTTSKNYSKNLNSRIIVQFDIGANSYSIGSDFKPYSEDLEIDKVISSTTLPDNITLLSPYDIVFNEDGFPVDRMGKIRPVLVSLARNGDIFETYRVLEDGIIK